MRRAASVGVVVGAVLVSHTIAAAQGAAGGPSPDSASATDPPRGGVCFAARADSAADLERLVAATEAATGTRFAVDGRHCIVAASLEPVAGRWERASSGLRAMAGEGVFRVDISFGGDDTRGEPGAGILIDPRAVGTAYGIQPTAQRACASGAGAVWSLPQIVAHELGHAYATFSQAGEAANDDEAMRWEYAAGDRERPRKPHRPPLCHRRS